MRFGRARRAAHFGAQRLPPTGWSRSPAARIRDAATDELLKRLPVKDHTNAGSSLKFCLVAAGEADIYPAGRPTMEWDTGAGHAVLRAAGGRVTTWEGAPFLYGKPGFFNGPFIARGL